MGTGFVSEQSVEQSSEDKTGSTGQVGQNAAHAQSYELNDWASKNERALARLDCEAPKEVCEPGDTATSDVASKANSLRDQFADLQLDLLASGEQAKASMLQVAAAYTQAYNSFSKVAHFKKPPDAHFVELLVSAVQAAIPFGSDLLLGLITGSKKPEGINKWTVNKLQDQVNSMLKGMVKAPSIGAPSAPTDPLTFYLTLAAQTQQLIADNVRVVNMWGRGARDLRDEASKGSEAAINVLETLDIDALKCTIAAWRESTHLLSHQAIEVGPNVTQTLEKKLWAQWVVQLKWLRKTSIKSPYRIGPGDIVYVEEYHEPTEPALKRMQELGISEANTGIWTSDADVAKLVGWGQAYLTEAKQ